MTMVETNPVPPPSSGSEYAGFSRRALAFSIDQILLMAIVIVVTLPLAILFGLVAMVAWPFVFIIFAPPVLPFTTIIAWAYFALQESSKHQGTVGKRMCGLCVTNAQGNRISVVQATLRFFFKFLSSAIMMIGWIMAAFTERHQALHDILADTLVLKKAR